MVCENEQRNRGMGKPGRGRKAAGRVYLLDQWRRSIGGKDSAVGECPFLCTVEDRDLYREIPQQ